MAQLELYFQVWDLTSPHIATTNTVTVHSWPDLDTAGIIPSAWSVKNLANCVNSSYSSS